MSKLKMINSEKRARMKHSPIPQYISNLLEYHITTTKHVRLLYGELLMQHKWLHCILKSRSANTVDIANIAVLFNYADTISFVLDKNDDIRSAQWRSLGSDLNKVHDMGLSTTFQFDLSQCGPVAREEMYQKAMSYCGDKYKCTQGERGNILIFNVVECTVIDDTVSVSSAVSSEMYERVQTMSKRVSTAQAKLKEVISPNSDRKQEEKENEPVIFDSGKQYYFWESHRGHPDFIEAEFQNLKDEVLNSPILAGSIDEKTWRHLIAQV